MSWNRWELGQKGIFYDPDIRCNGIPAALYPPHVETLRKSMLDFSCAILNCKEPYRLNGRRGNDDTDPALTAAQNAFYRALSIHEGGYSEKRWESFFQTHFFEPLAESVAVSKKDSRRVSRCNYYYDAFRAETNKLWDLFSGRADLASELDDFERVKCPKPDYAFYLPMYNLGDESGMPKILEPEARQWNQVPDYAIMERFSWSGLKELSSHGLQPTPFRAFHEPPKEASLNCYPWLLVEHKKEGVRGAEQTVCCQAANGGACAVRLNQNSARYAIEMPEDAHIPPIPTVTTIGSLVKVWIMYFAKDFQAPRAKQHFEGVTWTRRNNGYVMRAIWEGDMTRLGDIIKFQVILENTHTWAMRVFKPLVSSYIDQWKYVHCQVGTNAASAALLRRQQIIDRCQTVIPMIQTLLDDHPSIEIDDSKNTKVTPLLLGLIVQQICATERQALSDEVDRVVAERLGALNRHSESMTAERTPFGPRRIIQPRRTITSSDRLSLPSLPPVDNEDPDDSDYQPSQATEALRTASPADEPLETESEPRRRTRSNPRRPSPAQSSSMLPLDKSPSTDKAPRTHAIHHRRFRAPSLGTRPGALAASALASHTPPGRVSLGSPGGCPASLRPAVVQPGALQPSDARNSTGKTTPTLRLSSVSDAESLRGAFAAQQPSPGAPDSDWKSGSGPVRFDFQLAHADRWLNTQTSSEFGLMWEFSAEGGGGTQTKLLIDLTNDSQESPS